MVATPGGEGNVVPMMTLPPGVGGGSASPESTVASMKVIVDSENVPLGPTKWTEKVRTATAAPSGDIVIVETPSVRFGDIEVEPETIRLKEVAQPSTHSLTRIPYPPPHRVTPVNGGGWQRSMLDDAITPSVRVLLPPSATLSRQTI